MRGYVGVALSLGWVLIAIGPGAGRSRAAGPDFLVAGVAVYRDAADEKEYRAPSTELILVGGQFDGQHLNVPNSELDRDLTAGTMNGYRLRDEGIFHLVGDVGFRHVSIFYHLSPSQDSPGTPRFFSTSFQPRIVGNRGRRSVKVWLELQPTDRPIREARQLSRILEGIIRAHSFAPPRRGDRRDPRERMAQEFRIVAALLPGEADARKQLIDQSWEGLIQLFDPTFRPQLSDLRPMIFAILNDPVPKLLQQERSHWARFREVRGRPPQ